MEKIETCFSEENFSVVYNYIEDQIIKGNKPFYEYEGYELYAVEKMKIALKDKGYTLAVINRETGIFSLSIAKSSNERIVNKTNRIFCEILSLAKNKN